MTQALSMLLAAALITALTTLGGADATEPTARKSPSLRFVRGEEYVTRVARRDPVAIHLETLTPGVWVTLRLAMADGSSSHAIFVVGADGRIDTSRDAPLSGDYSGFHADGLFWSMTSDHPRVVPAQPFHVTVIADVAGTEVARATLERR